MDIKLQILKLLIIALVHPKPTLGCSHGQSMFHSRQEYMGKALG
jgi:hypothetical protein